MAKKRIYVVGIKGVAMANLAVMYAQQGHVIAGCDVPETFITDSLLQRYNIPLHVGFKAEYLPEDTDQVIYSASHMGVGNPVVAEARRRGIPVLSVGEALQLEMAKNEVSVAVCGTHGKTTTTGMLAHALLKLGVNPGYMVGVPYCGEMEGGNAGSDKYFVVEADEYAINPPHNNTPKFMLYSPTHVIALNIDFDHPDVFSSLEHVKSVFKQFFKKVSDTEGTVIYCYDDPELAEVITESNIESTHSYGFSEDADTHISEYKTEKDGTEFSIAINGSVFGSFRIKLFGDKNVLNAASVITFLAKHGFKAQQIAEAISEYAGANRRFQYCGSAHGVDIYDDYAHHPKEIQATIDAARDRFPGRKVVILFQPHTYSRTFALADGFAEALATADSAVVLPIFSSARENKDDFDISSQKIIEIAQNNGINTLHNAVDEKEAITMLKNIISEGDVVFTMGAGDVYTTGLRLLNE